MKTRKVNTFVKWISCLTLLCSVSASAQTEEKNAARFLTKASFGPNMDSIREVARMGQRAWLKKQLELTPTYHESFVKAAARAIERTALQQLERLEENGESGEVLEDRVFELYGDLEVMTRRFAWWDRTLYAPDQVRQRVAFALSEILVISDQNDEILDNTQGIANYYDILVRGALGNYRDMLLEVTLHPAMGLYLSHLNNARSDPAIGRFPDENYAREVMQLFSIGLYELKVNGERQLDDSGQPIATYSNREITEFAKIFTGLGDGGEEGAFGFGEEADLTVPMKMYDTFHEPGEKRLLNGKVVPAGQSGMKDIQDAIDNLFHHSNVGPFIGRQLIQRLVTSNPSAAYVQRVANAFADNGQGIRGDMKAVVSAVLLDPEALQEAVAERARFGHLQEPILRHVALLRAFGARSPTGYFLDIGEHLQQQLRQHPVSAPSVFNFFLPHHQPIGALADHGLVGPEFQITTSSSIISSANLLDEVLDGEVVELPGLPLACLMRPAQCDAYLLCESDDCLDQEAERLVDDVEEMAVAGFLASLKLNEERQLAQNNVPGLIDRLDLLLGQGRMSTSTKQGIRQATESLSDVDLRLRLAIYLTVLSPDVAVVN